MSMHCNLPVAVLVHGLTLAFLGALPAHAVVVQAGANSEQDRLREEQAHREGAKYKCMVNIQFPHPTGGYSDSGSGCYLGTSLDGTTGYILTAAHVCSSLDERMNLIPRTNGLAFLGSHAWQGPAIPIERTYLHPACGNGPNPSEWHNDIAVLTFKVADHHALEAAELCSNEDFPVGASQEAEGVGFGLFGTNRGGELVWNDRVHAGLTLVTNGHFQGRPALFNWTPLMPAAVEALRAGGSIDNLYHAFEATGSKLKVSDLGDWEPAQADRYRQSLDKNGFPAPDCCSRVTTFCTQAMAAFMGKASSPAPVANLWLQTHPEQVVFASGDSGGPLFITTHEGPKVAGVNSLGRPGLLLPEGGKAPVVPAFASVWEPVVNHLAWIKTILGTGPASDGALQPSTEAVVPEPTKPDASGNGPLASEGQG